MRNINHFIEQGQKRLGAVSHQALAAFNQLLVDCRESLYADVVPLEFARIERERLQGELRRMELDHIQDVERDVQAAKMKRDALIGLIDALKPLVAGLSPALRDKFNLAVAGLEGAQPVTPPPAPPSPPDPDVFAHALFDAPEWRQNAKDVLDCLAPDTLAYLRAYLCSLYVKPDTYTLDGSTLFGLIERDMQQADSTALLASFLRSTTDAWRPVEGTVDAPRVTPPPKKRTRHKANHGKPNPGKPAATTTTKEPS